MLNLSSKSAKILVSGIFAIAVLAFAQSTSFSQADAKLAQTATSAPVMRNSLLTGYADGSEKVAPPTGAKAAASGSTPCTVCKKRYYTEGTYYYMNYPVYQQCITEPCS